MHHQTNNTVFTQLRPMVFVGVVSICHTLTLAAYASCDNNMPKTIEEGRMQIINKGTEVKDTATNLVWQRCSIGQTWDGTTCAGTPTNLSWLEALTQAKALGNGYRLPHIKELFSLFEFQCTPKVDPVAFPNTSLNMYLSSTPAKPAIVTDITDEPVQFYYSVYFSLLGGTKAVFIRDGFNYHARAVRPATAED